MNDKFRQELPKLMFLLHMLSCDQRLLEMEKWDVAHFHVCMFSNILPCILVIWSVVLFYHFSLKLRLYHLLSGSKFQINENIK